MEESRAMNVLFCFEVGLETGGVVAGCCINGPIEKLTADVLVKKAEQFKSELRAQHPQFLLKELVWRSVCKLDD